MAIRGENVGTAYVRILADGSGLDDSIRDEFRKAEPAMEQGGERASEKYNEGFREGMVRGTKKNRQAMLDSLALGRGQMDARAKTISSNFAKSLRNELRRAVKGRSGDTTLADTIWNNLMGQFRRTGDTRVFSNYLENLNALVEDATRQIQDAERRQVAEWHSEALKMNREYDAERTRALTNFFQTQNTNLRRYTAEQARVEKESLDLRNRQLGNFFRNQSVALRRWNNAQRDMQRQRLMDEARMYHEAYQMNRQYDLQRRRSLETLREQYQLLGRETQQLLRGDRDAMGKSDLTDLLSNIRSEMTRLNYRNVLWNETLRDTDHALSRIVPGLSTFNKRIVVVSDRVGTMFGRGSRNNILNLFGSMTRGMTRLLFLGPRMAEGLIVASRAFRMVRTEGGSMAKAMGAFASSIGLSGVNITAFLSAAGSLGLVLPPLAATLSLAAGAAVALGSSLAFAAVGGVGALAGSLAPLGAGLGVLALAFYDMDEAKKEALKADAQPLVNQFKELAAVAREGVFSNFGNQARRASNVVADLSGIVAGVGVAISDVADNWLDMTEGEGFQRFVSAMGDFLPNAVRDLGAAFGNAIGGMGGVFRSLIPLTSDFLGWLSGITETFNNWANSTRGQNELTAFWADAKESLVDVGFFLGRVRDLTSEILSAGRGSGDNLFRSMGEAIEGWVDTLRANPDILRNWFDSAEDFGRAVGSVVRGLGRLFDLLDNDLSRTVANAGFDVLAAGLNTTASILGPLVRLFDSLPGPVQNFAAAAAAAAFILPRFNGALLTAKSHVTGLGASMRTSAGRMAAFKGAAGQVAGVGGLMLLANSASETSEAVGALKGAIGGALAGSVLGPVGAAVGGVAGGLMGLYSASSNADSALRANAESFQAARKAAQNYKDTLDTTNAAITTQTRYQALASLKNMKVLDESRKLGISSRDLVSALLGRVGAQRRVNRAMEQGRKAGGDYLNAASALELALYGVEGQMGQLGAKGRGLRDVFIEQRDAMRKEILAAGDLKVAMEGVPKKVRTEVAAIGVDMSLTQLQKLRDRYNLTPKQVRTIIRMVGFENARKQAERIARGLDVVDKKKPNPKINLNTREFDKKRRGTVADLLRLDKRKATPKADMNPNPFKGHFRDLMGNVRKLDNQKPTPRADLNKGPYDNAARNVLRSLNLLDRQKPRPTALLNDKASRPTGNIRDRLGDLNSYTASPTVSIVDRASGVIASIGRGLAGLAAKALTIDVPGLAAGGIGGVTSGAQLRWIGEAGPEAVVPLNRPLSQVDPSVRMLSAIAQGKIEGMANGGTVGAGKTYNVEQHIYSPVEDPRAVAAETINRLVAVGY